MSGHANVLNEIQPVSSIRAAVLNEMQPFEGLMQISQNN